MAKIEYPQWVYPGNDAARGLIVQDAEEHAVYLADPLKFEREARNKLNLPALSAVASTVVPMVRKNKGPRKAA